MSGFIGKVLVGEGAAEAGSYLLVALAFISSIFVLYSLLRVFLNSFWGETLISAEDQAPLKAGLLVPCIILTAGTFVIGLGAEYLAVYIKDAAYTLMNPEIYIEAILE